MYKLWEIDILSIQNIIKEELMDIRKYTSYFHDGSIYDIKHNGKKIVLSLESCELEPEWNEDNIPLSKLNLISGYLHLENVQNVYINKKKTHEKLEMIHDLGDIYHLEIKDNNMRMSASWSNDAPKLPEETDVIVYEIEAEKIYWENVPTAFDESWDELE